MKQHPVVLEDLGSHRKNQRSTREKIREIVDLVHQAESDRSPWLKRQDFYLDRRYAREGRDTEWPWPGASDIVMPTIDMTIDRIKSTFQRLIFTRPVVDFKARHPDSMDNALNARVFFDWLLGERIPDFREQILVGLDSILQFGHGIFKTYWDYKTRRVTRIIRRADLPQEFRDMLQEDEKVLQSYSQFAGQRVSEADIQRFVKNETKQRIQGLQSSLSSLISRRYGLDPDHEREEIAKIFRFFRDTKEEVRYKTREVICNSPRVVAIDPKDLIVPKNTMRLEDAEWLVHRVWMDEHTFASRIHDHGWSKKAVRNVLDNKRDDGTFQNEAGGLHSDQTNRIHEQREGINNTGRKGQIEILEAYWYEDVDNDGHEELVFAPIHRGTQALMRDVQEVPYQHGAHGFTQIKFELNNHRFYSSRGIPEKLDDIDLEITARHRNKLNNMDMMVPMFTYRYGSELNPDAVRFIPGDVIPVMEPGDYAPIDVPDRTQPDEREENILSTWVQRYLGGLDTGLVDNQNLSEARTATEISAIQRSASEMLSYRGEILQMGFKKIYRQIWDLWQQWGDKTVFIQVTGNEQKMVTKEDLRGDFDMTPIGTVQTTDPAQEEQRALQRLQVLVDLKSQGPEMLGTKYEIDIGEATALWLRRANHSDFQAVLRELTKEQQQALSEQLQRQAELVKNAEANVPQTQEEAVEAANILAKKSPHGKLQKIRR